MCAGEIKDKNIVTGVVVMEKEAADNCKPMTELRCCIKKIFPSQVSFLPDSSKMSFSIT